MQVLSSNIYFHHLKAYLGYLQLLFQVYAF